MNPAQLAGHLGADLDGLQRLCCANGRNRDWNRLLFYVPGNDRNRPAPTASTPAAATPAACRRTPGSRLGSLLG